MAVAKGEDTPAGMNWVPWQQALKMRSDELGSRAAAEARLRLDLAQWKLFFRCETLDGAEFENRLPYMFPPDFLDHVVIDGDGTGTYPGSSCVHFRRHGRHGVPEKWVETKPSLKIYRLQIGVPAQQYVLAADPGVYTLTGGAVEAVRADGVPPNGAVESGPAPPSKLVQDVVRVLDGLGLVENIHIKQESLLDMVNKRLPEPVGKRTLQTAQAVRRERSFKDPLI
jgi:hypothetical protein